MATRKRREWTTDDLLRMQEGPLRKRSRKKLDFEDEDEDEQWNIERSKEAEDSGEDEKGEGVEHGGERESDDTTDETSSDEQVHENASEDEEDLSVLPTASSSKSISRVSIMPRRTLLPAYKKDAPPINHHPSASFESFGISSSLLTALTSMSIRVPTEVQAACIPPLLKGE